VNSGISDRYEPDSGIVAPLNPFAEKNFLNFLLTQGCFRHVLIRNDKDIGKGCGTERHCHQQTDQYSFHNVFSSFCEITIITTPAA
jgi:hypothetical protein